MSASARISAALGGGSKVCELVPSGTMPVTVARSPVTALVMLVIGATVVAMTSRPEVGPVGVPAPDLAVVVVSPATVVMLAEQAASTRSSATPSTRAPAVRGVGRGEVGGGGGTGIASDPSCK